MDIFGLIPASSGVQATSVINSSMHYDLFDPAYVMVNFTSPISLTGVRAEASWIRRIMNIVMPRSGTILSKEWDVNEYALLRYSVVPPNICFIVS